MDKQTEELRKELCNIVKDSRYEDRCKYEARYRNDDWFWTDKIIAKLKELNYQKVIEKELPHVENTVGAHKRGQEDMLLRMLNYKYCEEIDND